MNYALIRSTDISNGPGIRVSVFVQGCTFKCPGCFNTSTWAFDKGAKFTDETINTILDLCKTKHIAGLSVLGGEPLHPKNREGVKNLLMKFREQYPDKDCWVWTGYQYEDLKGETVLNYIDILVDGRFEQDKADWRLLYRGSANQRVIDLKKTLAEDKLILLNV